VSKEMVTRNSDFLPNYPETRGKYWKAPRNKRENKKRELKHATTIETWQRFTFHTKGKTAPSCSIYIIE
jgi:hypothetical protein